MNAQALKNRIVAHRRVAAAELKPHPRNPRTHSPAQRAALQAILAEVGLARSLLAYVADADRPLGAAAPLTLIDGHLRKDELRGAEVEVEVLDVSDAEADKLLLTLDPLAQLADYDEEVLGRLRESAETESNDLAALWASLAARDAAALDELKRRGGPEKVAEEFFVLVRCADEKEQVALLRRFRREGLRRERETETREPPMPPLTITVESPVEDTPRVQQVRGLFDLPPVSHSRLTWEVALPLQERPWHVGLVVGPSGCGKSTVARALWPDAVRRSAGLSWPADRSLLDAFPEELSIKEITALLCAVGFSSPPAWLRPFPVLSTGQQFRATLARLLAEPAPLVVCDEFTSVVDRTVAQIGSAALARAVRARGRQFVAVTCHEDVEDWLQPDWTYQPALNLFQWRCLRRRPPIALRVVRCRPSAWALFAPHHYLTGRLNRSAACFLATWRGRPVAFSAWLPFVSAGPPARREHRTVTLPDYQGAGIGNALSALIASMWLGLGYRAGSTTTHPAMIRSRLASPLWRLRRAPSFAAGHQGRLRHATTRLTAGFEYVGPPLPPHLARALLGV